MITPVLVTALLAAASAATPDFSHQIAVSAWDGSQGQACPVTEHLALTARHLVYSSDGVRMDELRGSTESGLEGYFSVAKVYAASDLAVLHTTLTLKPYPISRQAPDTTERIWMQGYDWRNEKNAYYPRLFTSLVTRAVAGVLHYIPGGTGGTSGSCVLTAAGELVAIEVNKRMADNDKWTGGGIAVYGVWKPTLPEEGESDY